MTYYYGARMCPGGYEGVVYHYDQSGRREIVVWVGPVRTGENAAVDDTSMYCDDSDNPAVQNASLGHY